MSRFWLESMMFLAAVTLSAAVVQSRYSSGTIASKYDRLWEAGVLASAGVVPELQPLDLLECVRELAALSKLDPIDRLITISRNYMAALSVLAPLHRELVMMSEAQPPIAYADRFGFVSLLRESCGSGLQAIVVYGSSVSSESFADYDVLLVTNDAEACLRKLAGQSPRWHDKELNLGIYTPEEMIVMQCLSGDNLADYGVCLWGSTPVVHKSVPELLTRNFSFGIIRQRQQLGMLSRAVSDPIPEDGDDRQNLHEYFVKIPANVAKGTLGALGERWPKERVQEWMLREIGFDAVAEQRRVMNGGSIPALASSALATGNVLTALNEKVRHENPWLGVVEQVEEHKSEWD